MLQVPQDNLEPEDIIEWFQNPLTQNFLAELQERKDKFLLSAMNAATMDKDVSVALIKAKTLNEILKYAEGLRNGKGRN